ncbi:hypothetical protein BDP81DRAFT_177920 [Colletotrichum phormii]|uniref:Uncharacterized protein n=1 Tax=Colletotrichum phormii TaxID=359342 RepID=A0AAI9ZX74_9PEZI|nr:uncharacterized protein BDP81DRAFT_177920 [Colletotrichum phormii]KAK1639480.1 hypothetical protein BDP81DRAFT_177920 [Colletotrichum phormii]
MVPTGDYTLAGLLRPLPTPKEVGGIPPVRTNKVFDHLDFVLPTVHLFSLGNSSSARWGPPASETRHSQSKSARGSRTKLTRSPALWFSGLLATLRAALEMIFRPPDLGSFWTDLVVDLCETHDELNQKLLTLESLRPLWCHSACRVYRVCVLANRYDLRVC